MEEEADISIIIIIIIIIIIVAIAFLCLLHTWNLGQHVVGQALQ